MQNKNKLKYFLINKFLDLFGNYIFYPLVKIIWIKKITGFDNIPKKGGYIIAANQHGRFDFINLITIWPEKIIFIVAETYFRSKFWRLIMESTGQIKINRRYYDKSEAIKKAIKIIKQNKILGIFPQGAIGRNDTIETFYTGVAKIALLAKAPILPVGIKNTSDIFPSGSILPKFKKQVEIAIGKLIYINKYYKKTINDNLLKEITNNVMTEISILADKKLIIRKSKF